MDKTKTIEQLEKDCWNEAPDGVSKLIIKCHSLRKIPLAELEVEDVRLLVGQNVGLKFIVPLAMEILLEDPFIEGDFYEGDLLQNVLTSDKAYWESNSDLKKQLIEIFESSKSDLMKHEELTDEIKGDLLEAFDKFK